MICLEFCWEPERKFVFQNRFYPFFCLMLWISSSQQASQLVRNWNLNISSSESLMSLWSVNDTKKSVLLSPHCLMYVCAGLSVWTHACQCFNVSALVCLRHLSVLSDGLVCVSLWVHAEGRPQLLQHPADNTTSKLLCCSTFWGLGAQGGGALTTKKNLPEIEMYSHCCMEIRVCSRYKFWIGLKKSWPVEVFPQGNVASYMITRIPLLLSLVLEYFSPHQGWKDQTRNALDVQ